MVKISKILSGVAGEYFVAAELSRRGFIASISLRNTRNIDILCSTEDGKRSVTIQVKTHQGTQRQWLLRKAAETLQEENLFYVFVRLNGPDGMPAYHVVESTIVASHCREGHLRWLSELKHDGSPRKDTSMRTFRDPEGEYEGAWHRLRLE